MEQHRPDYDVENPQCSFLRLHYAPRPYLLVDRLRGRGGRRMSNPAETCYQQTSRHSSPFPPTSSNEGVCICSIGSPELEDRLPLYSCASEYNLTHIHPCVHPPTKTKFNSTPADAQKLNYRDEKLDAFVIGNITGKHCSSNSFNHKHFPESYSLTTTHFYYHHLLSTSPPLHMVLVAPNVPAKK